MKTDQEKLKEVDRLVQEAASILGEACNIAESIDDAEFRHEACQIIIANT